MPVHVAYFCRAGGPSRPHRLALRGLNADRLDVRGLFERVLGGDLGAQGVSQARDPDLARRDPDAAAWAATWWTSEGGSMTERYASIRSFGRGVLLLQNSIDHRSQFHDDWETTEELWTQQDQAPRLWCSHAWADGPGVGGWEWTATLASADASALARASEALDKHAVGVTASPFEVREPEGYAAWRDAAAASWARTCGGA